MPDTYWAVACLVLLVVLAFACVTVDALVKALHRARYDNARLNVALTEARANDNRNALGQYAPAYCTPAYETICTNPGGGYVENAANQSRA